MSLTVEARKYLDVSSEASPMFRGAIDGAMDALMDSLRSTGWRLAGDDRQAELEAAIVKYIVTSQVDL